MSTLVDIRTTQPMPPPVVPQRRRRDSTEVIDVDEWVDDRPTQRRRVATEVIDLMDSDDDEIQPVASGSGSLHRATRRYFSLPPPQGDEIQIIPPVPRLPHRQNAIRRLPMPYPTGNPILPNAEPFGFEAFFAPRAEAPQNPLPPSTPANPPLLRLGGAYSTTTHAADAQRRRERQERLNHQTQSGFRRRRQTGPQRGTTARLLALYDYAFDDSTGDFPWPVAQFDFADEILFHIGGGERVGGTSRKAYYKPEYTHPRAPEPGFSFDFAPTPSKTSTFPFPSTSKLNPIVIDDDDETSASASSTQASSSSSSAPASFSTALICAHCGDPLLMSVNGTAEEERMRKLWALRCGHMLDGKCVDALSMPPAAVDNDTPSEPSSSVIKGKGKAIERAPAFLLDNPVRARLRSHQSLSSSLNAGIEKMTSAILGKRKGKGKVKPDEIYQWACPVESCGRKHTSVKTNGQPWGPDKTRGEGIIGVFV